MRGCSEVGNRSGLSFRPRLMPPTWTFSMCGRKLRFEKPLWCGKSQLQRHEKTLQGRVKQNTQLKLHFLFDFVFYNVQKCGCFLRFFHWVPDVLWQKKRANKQAVQDVAQIDNKQPFEYVRAEYAISHVPLCFRNTLGVLLELYKNTVMFIMHFKNNPTCSNRTVKIRDGLEPLSSKSPKPPYS